MTTALTAITTALAASAAIMWVSLRLGRISDDVTAIENFAGCWDHLNSKEHPWSSNPWVWVIEFKVKRTRPINLVIACLISAFLLWVFWAVIEVVKHWPTSHPGVFTIQTGCYEPTTLRVYNDDLGNTTISGTVVPCKGEK